MADDDGVAVKSVKMPIFDGTHSTFQVWWLRFMTYATVHRFAEALNPKAAETELPATEATVVGTDAASKPAREAKRRNAVTFANLSLALNTEQLVRILVSRQTTDWPSGLAWIVVADLHKRYKPEDIVNVTMGNNLVEKATQVCDLHVTKCDKTGQAEFDLTLSDVALVPTAAFNLFSVKKLQLQGWQLGGNKDSIWLQHGQKRITFYIKINTPEGCVFAMNVSRNKEESKVGNVTKEQALTIQQAHDRFGHVGGNKTKEITNVLQIKITKGRVMLPCAACTAGKAKQKNIKRAKPVKQKIGQRRAYLDIAMIQKRTGMPVPLKPNWRILVVDQEIQIKFSGFYKTKDEMVEPTCEQLYKWQ